MNATSKAGWGSPQRGLIRLTTVWLEQFAGSLSSLLPDWDQRLVWREFKNKITVFDLFANVESALRLTPCLAWTLSELMERTILMDPFESVWAMEGIGHLMEERSWQAGRGPRSFLRDNASLSPRSLVPLHSGMGLSLAGRVLSTLDAESPGGEVRAAVERFHELCHDYSVEGLAMVAFESLGLVVRTLHPHLARQISLHLSDISFDLDDYFWHGVGRGLYFLPCNAMPSSCAPWKAVDCAVREPPHETGRRNAIAGVVWALALVNLRDPAIVALFLQHHAKTADAAVFQNGLASALLIWRYMAPGDSTLQSFLNYRPADQLLSQVWFRHVKGPCCGLYREERDSPFDRRLVSEAFRYKHPHDGGNQTAERRA
jgi:hypothetical protein